jgi:thiol-disulfide isomerase/thioredoxin
MPYTELAEHEELNECINNNNSVIIYYGAAWCRSCVRGGPVFETVSNMEEYEKVVFHKVDIDKIPEAKESQEIISIPLIIGYLKGKEVTRSVGVTVEHLVEIVEESLPVEENPEVLIDE